MVQIPFRTDEYGRNFYVEDENGLRVIPYKVGRVTDGNLVLEASEETLDDVLHISIRVSAASATAVKRLGFRLGIDCYMASYPEWNDKYFPSALRCEKQGFWSCFMSPVGKIISVCSPDPIVSWKNEYNLTDGGDVGHRIYTSSVELINTYPQPQRHPVSPETVTEAPITVELYYGCPEDEDAMYRFVQKYAGIHVPKANKYTLEAGEPLIIDGKPYEGVLKPGVNHIVTDNNAELTVYVRDNWFHYLDCAQQSAQRCQQKAGTHTESWYGYFSRVEYAKIVKNPVYTADLCREFDFIFDVMTEVVDGMRRMRRETLPFRLQNTAGMLSLLADMYELTEDQKYLDWAYGLADWLMQLQVEDGSYRNRGVLYTCVIYPAKSMLELATAEKQAGLEDRYQLHYDSAVRAVENLAVLLDDIETEGEMTFEDGMISCESLQLGYLAMLLPEGKEQEKFAKAAEFVLQKHRCLEQQFLPDCRVRGCTARFWEARYDLNFFINMLNSPHGWTSWKNYATYYLYMLTGRLSYLKDTMDTMGACVQCVDDKGILHWGYAADPCIVGMNLVKGSSKGNIRFEKIVVGETYMPMISDWYRQGEREMKLQYLSSCTDSSTWDEEYGGSCDNDVHEHFKCLAETVLGKAFVHETENGFVCYNCRQTDSGFVSEDPYLTQWVVHADSEKKMILNGVERHLQKEFNIFKA